VKHVSLQAEMSGATLLNLNFEPSGTHFFDNSDGSLCAVHAGPPVATHDGQFISSNNIHDSSVSIYLKTAQHGARMSLVLFEFTFFSPHQHSRIKYASIDIEFKYSATPRPPHIYAFCPRHVIGDEAKRTTKMAAGVGVSVGIQPSTGVNFSGSWTEGVERPSRFTLISKIVKTYSHGREINGIRWVLSENENTKGGIPHFVPIALLVKRKDARNFNARIKITANISPNLNPTSWFGMSASVPRPIVMDVKKVTGSSIVDDVDALDSAYLETLVKLPAYV